MDLRPRTRRPAPPSGRRDSNPRPSPWQGDALPTEPRPRTRPKWRGQASPAETDVRSRTLADPGRRANSARQPAAKPVTSVRGPAGQPGSRTPVSLSGLRTTSMAAIRPGRGEGAGPQRPPDRARNRHRDQQRAVPGDLPPGSPSASSPSCCWRQRPRRIRPARAQPVPGGQVNAVLRCVAAERPDLVSACLQLGGDPPPQRPRPPDDGDCRGFHTAQTTRPAIV